MKIIFFFISYFLLKVKEPSTTLIYVSNLPFNTTDENLRDLFKEYKIKTAYVARRKNGRSKGFGFVNLENANDQKAAIEKANGKEFESRKIIARVAFNDERRNEKGELREEFKTQTQGTPSETVIYVSNLAWDVNDEELRKLFQDCNPKVATVATRRNGRSKGFGFVEFNSKEDQEKALKMNGTKINERELIIRASTGYRGAENNKGEKRATNVVRRIDRKISHTLHIANLPLDLDENDLKDVFNEFHPTSTRIALGRNRSSKGFGFVEFGNEKDQTEALEALDQSEINGRVVTVSVSTSEKGRNQNRRGGNRNNNRGGRNNNNNRGGNQNRRYNNNNRNNNYNNRNNNQNRPRNNNNQNRERNNENREVSTNMVYVSNLPFSLDDNSLAGIFKSLNVSKAYISRRKNGMSRGYGFVEFSSNEGQQAALKNNGADVSGRSIVVQAAFKVENNTNTDTNTNTNTNTNN